MYLYNINSNTTSKEKKCQKKKTLINLTEFRRFLVRFIRNITNQISLHKLAVTGMCQQVKSLILGAHFE